MLYMYVRKGGQTGTIIPSINKKKPPSTLLHTLTSLHQTKQTTKNMQHFFLKKKKCFVCINENTKPYSSYSSKNEYGNERNW